MILFSGFKTVEKVPNCNSFNGRDIFAAACDKSNCSTGDF